ncbi:MAG TPA: CocE/NonD family hydrolase [Acidimicrobiales bacterium]|nr:CocE/NonD family hydrolase [Acidimicrobiales bacterium]
MAKVTAFETRVAMRDGVELATDVIAPADPAPALLIRTPYTRGMSRSFEDPIGAARKGWAVVVQDVRGRWDSDGTFSPFHQEVDDGHDAVAWVAAQPWCDGRVVGWGGSYVGATQYLAALGGHPALKAIAPVVSAASYDEGWTTEGGAMAAGFVVLWAAGMAATDPRATEAQRRAAAKLGEDWAALYRQPPSTSPLREMWPPFARWADGEATQWEPVDVARNVARLDLPAFHVAGWYDIFCESSLRAYTTLRDGAASPRARAAQRLIVGPWSHAGLYLDFVGDLVLGPAAAGATQGLPWVMLDWLRAAIDGEEVTSGVRVFVLGENRWRDLESWPPPATATPLWLADDGGLVWEQPTTVEGRSVVTYDPDDPTPTRGGRLLGAYLPGAGAYDQRVVEERDDVAVFTSAPLKKAVTVIGPVQAKVRVASTGPSLDVTVKLVDVWPDGRAMNVVDSIRRVEATPGRVKTVTVDVGSIAIRIPRGHRIRVDIAPANFPRFDLNPHPGTHTIHHKGSSVTLPLV